MGINSQTLGVGPEGGYVAPNFALVEKKQYSFEEICENIRRSLKYGDEGTWDATYWCTKAVAKLPKREEAIKAIKEETGLEKGWIDRAITVWTRFSQYREDPRYASLYFMHFFYLVDVKSDTSVEEWLNKATDEGWSARRLYSEITKSGEHSYARYAPFWNFKGYIQPSNIGFKCFKDEKAVKEDKDFVVIEQRLNEVKGKKIKISISIQQKGTQAASPRGPQAQSKDQADKDK